MSALKREGAGFPGENRMRNDGRGETSGKESGTSGN